MHLVNFYWTFPPIKSLLKCNYCLALIYGSHIFELRTNKFWNITTKKKDRKGTPCFYFQMVLILFDFVFFFHVRITIHKKKIPLNGGKWWLNIRAKYKRCSSNNNNTSHVNKLAELCSLRLVSTYLFNDLANIFVRNNGMARLERFFGFYPDISPHLPHYSILLLDPVCL